MKKITTIVCYLMLLSPLYAQNVSTEQASNIATNYFNIYHPGTFAKSEVSLLLTRNNGIDPLYYIFNVGSKGFVIVSGDMAVTPVLAYSDEGTFNAEHMAPALSQWLQGYADAISSVKQDNNRTSDPDWDRLSDQTQLKSLKGSTKGAMLTTKWDQGTGYNDACPAHQAGPGGHCVTGCVATAMAQVLKYYDYPEHGIGSHSYQHAFFGIISADFANATYDFASMTNEANSSSRAAISELMFHCGVAVDMNYSPVESGSSTYKAYLALKNYFHYRLTLTYAEKDSYSDFDWKIMLRDNLDQEMPIIYSGSGSGGGHAWVCDGYQDTTKFHFNWGWGGANNGYYRIDNLNPGSYDFTNGQEAVLNIAPYFAPYCQQGRVLTGKTKTFDDGSGYSYYWNNTGCDWLIQPASAIKVLLLFNDFQLEDGKDFVSVYDGTSTGGILLGTFTGHNIPPALTANSGSMFITFNSDEQNQDHGFSATYSAVMPAGIEAQTGTGNMAVWPVPATDHINLLLSPEIKGKTELRIFDIAGKLIRNETIEVAGETAVRIDVSGLSAGVYLLELTNDDFKTFGKFIK